MKKYVFIVVVLFWVSAYAQRSKSQRDSIFNLALTKTDPAQRAEGLLVYAQYLNAASTDSAIAFLDSLINVYQKGKALQEEGRAISLKSWFLNFQNKHKESVELGHRALKTLKKLHDTLGIAHAYNRVGLAYTYFQRYDDAEAYLLKSKALFEYLEDTVLLNMVLNNLGVINSEQGDDAEALTFYEQSLKIREKMGNFHWIAYSHFNIADSYQKLGQMDSAHAHYLKSVYLWRHKAPARKVPALGSAGLGEFFKSIGNTDSASYWLHKALADAQSINHSEVVILSEKLLSELYADTKDWQKAYAHLQVFNQLKSEVDSVNNHEKVAEIEARYQNAEKEAEISRLQAERLLVSNRNQQLWIVLGALVAAVLIVILIYQRRLQKNHLEKSELNRMLSETRMLALRAQMNPHFIFNAINTGQNFILNSNQAAAYDYLAKFARLLRLVLENSDKSFVPLEDEVLQVGLYLELEAIRFENAFSYSINMEDALKDGVTEVPGMFVQPLVENAIIHGISNLQSGRGELHLYFSREGDILKCLIRDNGVGRKRAAEIKKRKQIAYTSKALSNIEQRLHALKARFGKEVGLQINDLEKAGVPCGTEVILALPLR